MAARKSPKPGSARKPATVAEYLASAPVQARPHLKRIRAILRKVAPMAGEGLKWGQPVMEEGRILFAYAAHKAHLNFVPTGPALEPFAEELSDWKTGKDSVQFPYDRPLPEALIRRIATYRAQQVRKQDARWMY